MHDPEQAAEHLRFLLESKDPRLVRILRSARADDCRSPTSRQLEAYFYVEVKRATLKEAAHIMRVSPQSVHALLQRARRKVRDQARDARVRP